MEQVTPRQPLILGGGDARRLQDEIGDDMSQNDGPEQRHQRLAFSRQAAR